MTSPRLTGPLCGLLLSLAATAVLADIGWYDEPLPDGMVRGAEQGEYLWQRDRAVMVYVPPGEFVLGRDDGDRDERPARRIWLDGYYIDKHETSWAQWKHSGLPYSEKPNSRRDYPEAPDWGIRDDHPVTNVNWHYAKRYAAWAGKRLPTEAQWEKAARGADARLFPWGDETPTVEQAVWNETPISKVSTAPVDCCSGGASPYGVLNLSGNVYEWCADTYAADFYARAPARNPVNEQPGRYRVLRGGAFLLELSQLRATLRYRLYPEDRVDYLGMRTVVPAPAGDAGSD